MKISTEYLNGSLTVYLSGELDHHCARDTMERIEREIEAFLPKSLVLDMSALSFMDSSGIAVILKASRKLGHCGGRMYVENPQRQPYKVLDAAGVDRLAAIRVSDTVK